MSFNPKALKSKKKDRPQKENRNVSHLINHSHIIETRKTKIKYPSNDNSIKSCIDKAKKEGKRLRVLW